MSLLGMPFAIINLGCEMVYILHQRLQTQGIPPDKGIKVLQDIVATMFEPSFLADKLFVPQDMYSLPSTRKVFDKIAHSSIMKLSENSMDKLFDLMVMGVKYCLVCSTSLEDILQVTLRHVGTVQALLTTAMAATSAAASVDAATIRLLSNAQEAVTRFYAGLSTGELQLLRCTLARYFQDKRIRVSLFLTEGIQLPSGKLVMASCLNDRVGLVRTFNTDGQLEGEERLPLGSQEVAAQEFFCHPVPLGANLYDKDRPKVVPPSRSVEGGASSLQQKGSDACTTSPAAGPGTAAEQQDTAAGSNAERYEQEQGGAGGKAAARELDFLAALVHTGGHVSTADNFKLNLCVDDDGLFSQPAQSSTGPSKLQQELQFGSAGKNEAYIKAARLGAVLEAVHLDDAGDTGKGGDLLDLMDSLT